MVRPAVCLERKLFIPKVTVEQVTEVCHEAFKEMGLKIMETKKTKEETVKILAGERALVPLTLKALLYPFSLQEYVKTAQRSGVHVVVSPIEGGVNVYSCGIALDEISGKPAKYGKDEVAEEITDTMEALDFESKFLNKIKQHFKNAKEVE